MLPRPYTKYYMFCSIFESKFKGKNLLLSHDKISYRHIDAIDWYFFAIYSQFRLTFICQNSFKFDNLQVFEKFFLFIRYNHSDHQQLMVLHESCLQCDQMVIF